MGCAGDTPYPHDVGARAASLFMVLAFCSLRAAPQSSTTVNRVAKADGTTATPSRLNSTRP